MDESRLKLYKLLLMNEGMKDGWIDVEIDRKINIMHGNLNEEAAAFVILKERFPNAWEKQHKIDEERKMTENTYKVKKIYTKNQDGQALKTKKGATYFRLILEGIDSAVSFFEGNLPDGLEEGMQVYADVTQSGNWWNGKDCRIVEGSEPEYKKDLGTKIHEDRTTKSVSQLREELKAEEHPAGRGHIENMIMDILELESRDRLNTTMVQLIKKLEAKE